MKDFLENVFLSLCALVIFLKIVFFTIKQKLF